MIVSRLHSSSYLWCALSVLTLVSCREDSQLVEKREKQKVEITRLKAEVALIEEKLKDLPPDVSLALAEAKQVSEKQSAEVERLEGVVAELNARKRSLQSKFDDYRVKYQAK